MSEEHDDDAWFHESLHRYDRLDMFEIEYPIIQIKQSSPSSLVCLSKKTDGLHVLSELGLPHKILSPSQPTNDYNLKIMSGIFLQKPTFQIVVDQARQLVFASEDSSQGVHMYKLDGEATGSLSDQGSLKHHCVRPSLAALDSTLAICCTQGEHLVLYDVSADSVSGTLDKAGSSLTPLFCNHTTLAVCCGSSGSISMYDIRTLSRIEMLERPGKLPHCFASSWPVEPSQDAFLLATLNSTGTLSVFDSRNWKEPFCLYDGLPSGGSSSHIEFGFQGTISVGGLDSNIYILRRNKSILSSIFVHDGHSHVENCDTITTTTSHFWLNEVSEHTVVSSADNCSINYWQFNSKF